MKGRIKNEVIHSVPPLRCSALAFEVHSTLRCWRLLSALQCNRFVIQKSKTYLMSGTVIEDSAIFVAKMIFLMVRKRQMDNKIGHLSFMFC